MILRFQDFSPVLGRGVFVAPNATVIGRVSVGDRASIWFGTVIRGDVDSITIGPESNIQDLSVVHADADTPTVVGSRVTVGHRAILHGCSVGDECVIGMGSVIQNNARIGSHSIVASGSVVREGFEVPVGTLVAGVPAVVKRELNGTEIDYINELAETYIGRAQLYLEISRPGPGPA